MIEPAYTLYNYSYICDKIIITVSDQIKMGLQILNLKELILETLTFL